ncbi:MAG: ATP-binding protein [Pseudomonadota bacterium]
MNPQFTESNRDHFYQAVAEAVPCYLTVQDRNRNVLWSNALYQDQFGLTENHSCNDLCQSKDGRCSDCPVEKTFQDGEIHGREAAITTKDGERINLMIYSSPLRDETGEITAVVQMGVNITSVKDMQKQLILLGQTVAGMAHGLKNIMMGLDGGIYVVNRGLQDKDQKEVREGWEMVLFNYDKIAKIVKDILYCSKDRQPNFREVNPNSVIREVHDLFRDTAGRYGISFQLDLDEHVTDAVMDPDGLHSVISNLVTNAIDACKMDLWKDEHLIELRSRKRANGSIVIEVADNGTGIGHDLKDHVFEDFFSSKGDKGTGLGLMVTQKVMNEHGGRITFRSRPGQGTTFVATFPERRIEE